MIPFTKYCGAGNDFIIIDNRVPFFSPSLVTKMCDRHFGIGADGVILLENGVNAPYKMRIFNADGSQAEMCGNGLRSLTHFMHVNGLREDIYKIENIEGKIFETFISQEGVCIKMVNPRDFSWNISIEDKIFHYVNTGVPHVVSFLKNIEELDVKKEGLFFRNHKHFQPKGTNVNFVSVDGPQSLSIRTYERGVEDETLACGTGSVAAALCASKIFNLTPPFNVKVRSGSHLKINFKKENEGFSEVTLEGEAKQIFTGSIII